jgi:hypothetical protein
MHAQLCDPGEREPVRCHDVQQLQRCPMFLFFSNKLGCLGSVLVSLVVTLLLLLAFGVL